MKIAISGATGFIGTHLTAYLTGLGHRAVPLGRPAFRSQESLAAALAGCGAVVNLAGAPIDRRWSDAYKKQLYDSRIGTTRKLVAAINEMNPAPKVFVSASAVGYYPDQGCYDEYTAVKGTGFLSDLCESWEREASRLVPGIRLAVARFGVVLAPDEGVFAKMAFPFRKGIAVRIASGAQIFAWIDIGDLVRALTFILSSDMLAGAINLTAPERLTNAAFARAAVTPPVYTWRFPVGRSGCFMERLPVCWFRARARFPGNCWMPDSFSMRRRSPRLCRNSAKRPRSERPCRVPSGGSESKRSIPF